MPAKKLIKRVSLVILLGALSFAIYYAWVSFPIISGFSAKNACSCAFIQNRSKEDINKQELSSFPLSIGSIDINYKDSSVTGTVLGLAKRKAIYRKGLGCTLVNEIKEEILRSQVFVIPIAPQIPDTSTVLSDAIADSSQLINQPRLSQAVNVAFETNYRSKKIETKAVLIVRNGKIIAERYANGYSDTTPCLGWSMAKSVTSALIGILVKQNKLNETQSAPVPEWSKPSDPRHKITLQHILQQCSGLKFGENYSSYSDATNMLFNKADMGAYTASRPLKDTPGTRFYYSSGNSNILARLVRATVGDKEYAAFPYTALFYKLGMNHTLFEPDASGTYVGSSYIYASARDYARFGLFYLNDGIWKGERILPEGWVKRSTTAPAHDELQHYGYQFWLNGRPNINSSQLEYPEAPADLFYADGYGGQRIFIIPSKQLVIVRLGLNNFDEHRFLSEVFTALN